MKGRPFFAMVLAALAVAFTLCPAARGAEYRAYSLKIARQRIEQRKQNWRTKEPAIVQLAGINKVDGFIYDTRNHDLILVGQHESDRAALTLDDLVVALRSRLRYGEWPLVSLDPTSETPTTGMHRVRFAGGIDGTAFGQAMLDADYQLKRIAMGLVEPGVDGVRTLWTRSVEGAQRGLMGGQSAISGRFWFYPINPHVVVRDGVAVIRGLRVAVFHEVLSATVNGKRVEDIRQFKDGSAEGFVSDVSSTFDDLCRHQPSLDRLRGLEELVGLTKALEELILYGGETSAVPDLSWWLDEYSVSTVQVPKELRELRRAWSDGDARPSRGLVLSGGVELTALAMRLEAGDVRALRDTVLKVRPSGDSLCWGFLAAGWIVPLAGKPGGQEDVGPLLQHAVFLRDQGRFADALVDYERLTDIAPSRSEFWNDRGALLSLLHRHDESLTCLDKATKVAPRNAMAWANRATALLGLKRGADALASVDRALGISQHLFEPWAIKGTVLSELGRREEALVCFDQAIARNSRRFEVWENKANALNALKRNDEALKCLDRALEIQPLDATLWSHRGSILSDLGSGDDALKSHEKALGIDARNAMAWNNKGAAEQALGRNADALASYGKAAEIDPKSVLAWINKANVLGLLGKYDQASACFDKALDLSPNNRQAQRGKDWVAEIAAKATLKDFVSLPGMVTSWRDLVMIEFTFQPAVLVKHDTNGRPVEAYYKDQHISRTDVALIPVTGTAMVKVAGTTRRVPVKSMSPDEYMSLWISDETGKVTYSINLTEQSFGGPIIWHWGAYTQTALNPRAIQEGFSPPPGGLAPKPNRFLAKPADSLSDQYFMIDGSHDTFALNFTNAGLTARVHDVICWGYPPSRQIELIPGSGYWYAGTNDSVGYIEMLPAPAPDKSLFFSHHNLRASRQ
jgi:tetratricopeptide (TPR) repeat protein